MKLVRNICISCCVVLGLVVFTMFTACDPGSSGGTSGVTGGTVGVKPQVPDEDRNECSSGGGKCSEDDTCVAQCDEDSTLKGVFKSRKDIEACKELSVKQVAQIHKVFSPGDGILKDPKRDELTDICLSAIKDMTATGGGLEIWQDYISEHYKNVEAINVVSWMAENPSVYESIQYEDEEDFNEFLDVLLKKLHSLSDSYVTILTKDIDRKTYVLNLAVEKNFDFVEKIYDLFDADDSNCSSGAHKKPRCFLKNILCETDDGEYIFDNSFEDLINIGEVSDYIDDEMDNLSSRDSKKVESVCTHSSLKKQ